MSNTPLPASERPHNPLFTQALLDRVIAEALVSDTGLTPEAQRRCHNARIDRYGEPNASALAHALRSISLDPDDWFSLMSAAIMVVDGEARAQVLRT